MLDRFKSSLEDALSDQLQILLTLLELAGSPSNQSGWREQFGIWRGHKKCHFNKVKWKQGLNTMDHKIWGQTGRPKHSNMFGPKERVSSSMPAGLPPRGTFDDGLPDIEMTPFNYAVRL